MASHEHVHLHAARKARDASAISATGTALHHVNSAISAVGGPLRRAKETLEGASQRQPHASGDAVRHDPKTGRFVPGKGVSGTPGTVSMAKAHREAAQHHRQSAGHYRGFGSPYSHPGYKAHAEAERLHAMASGAHTAHRLNPGSLTFTRQHAMSETSKANAATRKADYEWEPKKRDEGRYERGGDQAVGGESYIGKKKVGYSINTALDAHMRRFRAGD